jgi:hypothetical protein
MRRGRGRLALDPLDAPGERQKDEERGKPFLPVARVRQRVFRRLLPDPPTPERCVEVYYLQRTRLECIAERKPALAAVDRGRECGD